MLLVPALNFSESDNLILIKCMKNGADRILNLVGERCLGRQTGGGNDISKQNRAAAGL